MTPSTAEFLQTGSERGGVTRCNSHESLVREITLLGADVKHSIETTEANYRALKADNEDTKKTLKTLTDETTKQSKALDNLDPAATRSRLAYHGLIVSGGVSLLVAIVANVDKLLPVWRYFFGSPV